MGCRRTTRRVSPRVPRRPARRAVLRVRRPTRPSAKAARRAECDAVVPRGNSIARSIRYAGVMTTHFVELARTNLRDCFDCSFPPVLTIDPGDIVIYRTLDA